MELVFFWKLVDIGLSSCSAVVVVEGQKLGHFVGVMSLFQSFCLRQFYTPLRKAKTTNWESEYLTREINCDLLRLYSYKKLSG